MPDNDRISGWIFVSSDLNQVVFVPRFFALDATKLPWGVLADQHSFSLFEEEFALREPIKVQHLKRFKFDADFEHLQSWLRGKEK